MPRIANDMRLGANGWGLKMVHFFHRPSNYRVFSVVFHVTAIRPQKTQLQTGHRGVFKQKKTRKISPFGAPLGAKDRGVSHGCRGQLGIFCCSADCLVFSFAGPLLQPPTVLGKDERLQTRSNYQHSFLWHIQISKIEFTCCFTDSVSKSVGLFNASIGLINATNIGV